jgi:antitoxin HicB
MSGKTYTVSDGTLMLTLEVAEEGGYNVTSPLDPQLITQAETLEEAFENAYEVQGMLQEIRAELIHEYLKATTALQAERLAVAKARREQEVSSTA